MCRKNAHTRTDKRKKNSTLRGKRKEYRVKKLTRSNVRIKFSTLREKQRRTNESNKSTEQEPSKAKKNK